MYKTPLELKVEALEERVRTLEDKSGVVTKAHESYADSTNKSAPTPTPTHAESTRQSGSTELWLGRQGLSFIGTALLLLGLAFLLIYSIQYLGAWGRDLLGLGTALGLFGLSRYLEPKTKNFSQFLYAGSVALTYFTVYAMHFFDVSRVINSQPFDLALLALVGIGATWYSLAHYKTETASAVSYALIYLTFFVGDLTLFSFWGLLIATLGIVGLATWKQWPGALLVGVILTYATYFFWGTALGGTATLFGSSSQLTFDLVFLSLYFLLFSLPTLRLPEDHAESPAIVFVVNSACYAVLLVGQLQPVANGPAYLLFGLSVYHYLYTLVAHLLDRRKLHAAAVTVGSLALIGAIPLYWHAGSLAWAWLLVGVGQLLLSLILRIESLRFTGLVSLTLGAGHFFFIDLALEEFLGNTTVAARVLLGSAMAILTLGTAAIYAYKEGLDHHDGLRLYLNVLGLGALTALAGVELESTYITLAWGILGVLALLVGILGKDQQVRNPAFIVILLMLGRAVFIDLAQAETVIRIVAFVVLGIVLLGASWVYHRYLSDEQSKPSR